MILRRILLMAVITSFFANVAFAKGGHQGGGAFTDLTPGKFDYPSLAGKIFSGERYAAKYYR